MSAGSSGPLVSPSRTRFFIAVALVSSALALGLAPMAVPGSYSWVAQTTSEAAAQGVRGAWVARAGFLLFGLAVLWLASVARSRWGRIGRWALGTFGVAMLAVATFSHRPWVPDMPFDPTEDFLHSAASTVMGFAFAGGVAVVGLRREGGSWLDGVLDILALGSSVFVPLLMWEAPEFSGVLQRVLFLVAYIWFLREALRKPSRAGRR